MKKLLLILLVVVSCKPKQVYLETHSIDTIKVKEVITIQPSQLNQLIIDTPCDSLGKLKPINYTFGTDNDKTTVKTTHNKLIIAQKKDSVISTEKETATISKTTSASVKIKYKYPKWIWYSLGFNLLVLLYILKKFTSIFNFLPF